jgi:hypothetical protein
MMKTTIVLWANTGLNMGELIRVDFKKKHRERAKKILQVRLKRMSDRYGKWHARWETAFWLVLVSLFGIFGLYVCFFTLK